MIATHALLRLIGSCYGTVQELINALQGQSMSQDSASERELSEALEACNSSLAEALAYQKATSEILHAISVPTMDATGILQTIAESAAKLLDVSDAEILHVEGDMLRSVARYGPSPQWPVGTLRAINRGWITGRAVVDRVLIQVADLQTEEAEFPQGAAFAREYGHRTTLATPLLREGAAIGAILIRKMEVRLLTEKQIAQLMTFADQAAIAFEHVRLLTEIRDKTRQVEEQASQLAEWNRTLETRVDEQVSQIGRMSKLTRFLSPKISDMIMSTEGEDSLKARRAEVTVVYVDLRGFTGFTETAEPEEVMNVLRQYHGELGKLIMAHDGTIEHFAGDGMLILFNAPLPVPDHELQAVRMALSMREALTGLSAEWRKRGHELGFGVGIAGGYATIGTIGFEHRLDYGAVGPATNLAARLCGEAKPGQILIAPRIFAKLDQQIEVEAVGDLVLKGFHRPVAAYNVLNLRIG